MKIAADGIVLRLRWLCLVCLVRARDGYESWGVCHHGLVYDVRDP